MFSSIIGEYIRDSYLYRAHLEPYIFRVGSVKSLIFFIPSLYNNSISRTMLSLLLFATSFPCTSGMTQKEHEPQQPLPIATEELRYSTMPLFSSRFFDDGC